MRFALPTGPVRLLPVFVLAVFGAVGCCGDSGTITGVVKKADGTVVKGGDIVFTTADGHGVSADIDENGNYKAEKVPLGDVKVTISTAKYKPSGNAAPSYQAPSGMKNPNAPPDPAVAAARYVKLDDVYADPSKTPLSLNVKGGSQTYNPPDVK